MKNYQEAIQWLYSQIPNYQNVGKTAYKPGLDNIKHLCQQIGNPQEKFKSIHIAGTNGKGSTCNMLASVLLEAGYKVGLFTSPHLKNFTERIRVNGTECSEDYVFNFLQKIKTVINNDFVPSFFELTTAMAFDYFSLEKVDIAVIEVGLGGRLDSTNIIHPEVCAITSISFDHQDLLGDTLEKIAFEKAGIIKKNVPIVIGEEKENIKKYLIEQAKLKESPSIDATTIKSELKSDLQGIYQTQNIKTALGVISVLNNKGYILSKENIKQGLLNVQKNMNFHGRWEILQKENPMIVCDTGHNEDGFKMLQKQFNQLKYKNLHIVIGFVKGKDIHSILQYLPQNAKYYFVKPKIERGLNPEEYKGELAHNIKNFQIFNTVSEGLNEAKNSAIQGDIIFIGGSNFVVSEIL